MLSKLLINYEETASVILFCIGFSTMLLNKNLIKKIIGMDIMDSAVFLLLASQGLIKGGPVAIVGVGIQSVESGADGHCRFRQCVGADAGAFHPAVLSLQHAEPRRDHRAFGKGGGLTCSSFRTSPSSASC